MNSSSYTTVCYDSHAQTIHTTSAPFLVRFVLPEYKDGSFLKLFLGINSVVAISPMEESAVQSHLYVKCIIDNLLMQSDFV